MFKNVVTAGNNKIYCKTSQEIIDAVPTEIKKNWSFFKSVNDDQITTGMARNACTKLDACQFQ